MEYKDINEYVKTLSPEEKEFHKSIIKECTQREKYLKETFRSAKENTEKLGKSVDSLLTGIETFSKETEKLAKVTEEVKNKVEIVKAYKEKEDTEYSH